MGASLTAWGNWGGAKVLGVLGGMGPLATVAFMHKIIVATHAACDQDHVPMIVQSMPQIPDRSDAIMAGGESPLPYLLEGLERLKVAGATCIAIPCNTAHYWFSSMAARAGIPILHIADAACDSLASRGVHAGSSVGVLATPGTLAAHVYEERLEARGLRCITPTPQEMQELVQPGIRLVKAGHLRTAADLLKRAVTSVRERGANTVILGCTEIPLALEPPLAHTVDATSALANACVRWWTSQKRSMCKRQLSEDMAS